MYKSRHLGFRIEYRTWLMMNYRCNDLNNKNYGGRGIKVCDEWKNSFDTFLEDMGPKPEGYSIERIDNNGNYEPKNCKWATLSEQAQNKRKGVIRNISPHSRYLVYMPAHNRKRLS